MTPALSRSFAEQQGRRGIHFCEGDECRFALWPEVLEFCERVRNRDGSSDDFEEQVLHHMMSTNADNEFVVVSQKGAKIHIELYRGID